MTPESPIFERVAARWRTRLSWGVAGLAIALAALVLVALSRYAALGLKAAGTVAVGAGLAILGVGLSLIRRRYSDLGVVARHLDRVVPGIEESAELLLAAETSLDIVQRLQVERAKRAVAQAGEPPLPWGTSRRLWAVAGTVAGLALVLAVLPHSLAPGAKPGGASGATATAATVRDVAVTIAPPDYTHRAAHSQAMWDITAEEGAALTWRVKLSRPVASARLVTVDGDSVVLQAQGSSPDLVATGSASRSTLYQLVLQDADGGAPAWSSEYHRLTVERDLPPIIVVETPEERTQLPSAAVSVPTLVRVTDDYGVESTEIVATLTSGAGEQVKFREQRLPFTSTQNIAGPGVELRRTLDLKQLGLGPGDELYFYVLARDNRLPNPQETRSETFFIAITDTAKAETGTLAGVSLRLAPEYFRSQRQIIIDTEKLLADRPHITLTEFRNRSHNIGIDQELLRVRYGELVGQETEGEAAEAPSSAEELTHQHDIAENATRLAGSVKATLSAAVREMWDAELRLRTFDPAAALPYEYKALDFLKQVQQAARIYVQRVGFEPPPLEPDRKRLTGNLKSIPERATVQDRPYPAPEPVLRHALAVLQGIADGGKVTVDDAAILRAAGVELSPRAVENPGRFLPALEALRRLIAGAGTDSVAKCAGCPDRARQGIWAALPPPELGAPVLQRVPATLGSADYFNALGVAP
jgi:hypothetical protein